MSSVGVNLLKSRLYHAGAPCLVIAGQLAPGKLSAPPAPAMSCEDEVDAATEVQVLSGLRAAAEVVEAAERRAAEIITRAESEAAAVAAEAARRAREEALLELESHLAAQRELAAAQAEEMLAAARAQSQLALAAVEREAISLALEIARKVVARELEVSPEVVLAVAAEALCRLPNGVPAAALRVNPADVQMALAGRERLKGISGDLRELDVIPHPQVSRGGCIVETAAGDVDARIEARFEKLAQVLLPDAGDRGLGL